MPQPSSPAAPSNRRPLPSLLAAFALGALALTACTKQQSEAEQTAALAAAPKPSADARVLPIRCGCEIEAVGSCGEFVEVDGAFVPLKLPVDLGSMPFCGKDDLRAKLDGQVVDGTFVATSFAYVE